MQYNVISQLDLADMPQDICGISPTQVAVAYNNYDSYEDYDAYDIAFEWCTIQFLTVNSRHIALDRELTFKHRCYGIAHYKSSLYVTSGTELYQYTLGCRMLKTIYGDPSDLYTGKLP
ncbi:hypothetical protein DPMN_088759 [Dreissena polymorpha]|uniref:Uncharacterized protein n=1 Tax=Dreissena polymorpha TaxID=45954 RepID=A0A9D4KUP3_DREPO|nr:hypothetical protein DPMN_088759 [Dreissena polymorpha]